MAKLKASEKVKNFFVWAANAKSRFEEKKDELGEALLSIYGIIVYVMEGRSIELK